MFREGVRTRPFCLSSMVTTLSDQVNEILQYLKDHGEKLDSEVASGTGISLAQARAGLSALSLKGDVMTCRVIRYTDGKQIDGTLYRAAGYVPKPAPGRKSKAELRARAGERAAE